MYIKLILAYQNVTQPDSKFVQLQTFASKKANIDKSELYKDKIIHTIVFSFTVSGH